MRRPMMLRTLATMAFTISILTAIPAPVTSPAEGQPLDQPVVRRPVPPRARPPALAFARTELYFGTLKPNGVVTEAEFFDFLDDHVTPRFPEGLTVLRSVGQFRGEDGVIIREVSFILILLYPYADLRESNGKIEAIRQLYKDAFQQESVLRVDDRSTVLVSF